MFRLATLNDRAVELHDVTTALAGTVPTRRIRHSS